MIKVNLANFFTCCNLFTGCIAAVMVFRNQPDIAALLVLLSAFFDLLDGLAARKRDTFSTFGKELDSLADVVSFGFVPAAILFKLGEQVDWGHSLPEGIAEIILFFPFIITVFSALRLAKFNIDTRQSENFIGLPTPANGIFISSLPLVTKQYPGVFDAFLSSPYFIIGLTILSSFLLVSEIRLFSLKFKTRGFKENMYQYMLVLTTLILFPFMLFAVIPIAIVLYIFLSIISNLAKSKS